MSDGPLESNVVAEIGVAMAVEYLLRSGFHVAVPIVDVGYDLLAYSGRRFWRLQVKSTARLGANRSRVRLSRGSSRKQRYSSAHADAFVGVHVRDRKVVCVPLSKCCNRAWINFPQHKHGDFSPLRRTRGRLR